MAYEKSKGKGLTESLHRKRSSHWHIPMGSHPHCNLGILALMRYHLDKQWILCSRTDGSKRNLVCRCSRSLDLLWVAAQLVQCCSCCWTPRRWQWSQAEDLGWLLSELLWGHWRGAGVEKETWWFAWFFFLIRKTSFIGIRLSIYIYRRQFLPALYCLKGCTGHLPHDHKQKAWVCYVWVGGTDSLGERGKAELHRVLTN